MSSLTPANQPEANNSPSPPAADDNEKAAGAIPARDESPPPVNEVTLKAESLAAGHKMGTNRRRIVMLALCLALFLAALDITIVSTALPTIARDLGANASQYAWVGSAYTLASTSSTPIWARFSDIFGRKSVIMASNVTFMAGSLVSALAHSVTMLIAGRVLQGLGGGGLLVLVTIIIGDLFELRDRAKYYALTGIVWAIASSTGPLLGGVFTEKISWRWCFWINLPFDGASLVVLFFVLKVDWPHTPFIDGLKSLDWIGSILIVGGTICFLYGLETGAGGLQPWGSAMVICLLVFGALIMAAFFAYEARIAKHPIIPVRIFATTSNLAAFATSTIHSFVFISFDFFLPLYFQVVLGFSPIISGVSIFALVIPLSFTTGMSGFFVRRTGNYLPPTWIGAVLMTVGTGLFIDLGPTTDWAKIIVFQFVAGIGAGPLFQTPTIALQSQLAQKDISAAMAALSFMRTLMSSSSIVIGSVLLQKTLGGQSLAVGSTQSTQNGGGPDAISNIGDTYVSALRIMWIFYTALSGLLVVVTLFIKKADLKAPAKTAIPGSSDGELENSDGAVGRKGEATADKAV